MFFFLRSDQFMQDFSCIFWWTSFCPNFVLKGLFWLGNDFKGLSMIKLKLISFFIAHYLFDGTSWTRNKSVIWRRFQFLFNFFLKNFLRNFFHCCPLPYSLPSGSSARTLRRGRQAEFDGTGGTDGTGRTGNICVLQFFSF